MKIVCQSCSATYRIADEKVQGKKVFKIKCKKCGEDILVRGTDLPGEAPDEATRMMDTAGAEPIWHAVVNGDQQGPFTFEQVRELIAQGAVDGETYVWREGFDNWLPLHSVDELAGAFGPAPSIAPSAEMPAAGGDLFASMAPPPEEPERPSHVQPAAHVAAPVDNGLFAAMDAPRPAAQPAAAQPAAQPARAEPAKARAKTGGGDLFAAEALQQESSRPLFSEEPAASAGHDAGGESMTGQRNENSVLFSLASLQQLSTTRETKSAGEASGDASGLIDINKLAGAIGNAPANGAKKSSVDDILTVGASSGLGSPLAAPVLAPVAVPTAPVTAAPIEAARPAAGNKNMTAAIIGAAVIVMGGIVGAAYMVTSRNEPANTQGPVAAANPQPATPGNTVPEAAPTPTAAPTPAPSAAPEAAPSPAAPSAAATPEPAAAPERDRERDRERRADRRDRDRERPAPASEPAAAPARPAPAAAPARPAAPARRAQGGSIEELMGQVTAGSNSRPSGNSGGGNSGGGNSGGGDVPEAPSRPAVASALRGVGPAVRACGTGTGGTATVTVVFNSSGGVNTANVQPPYAGTPVGSCIARAVRGAHIPPFSRPSFTVNYPFPLQ